MSDQGPQRKKVERSEADVYINSLNHVRSVSDFIRAIQGGIGQGIREFTVMS